MRQTFKCGHKGKGTFCHRCAQVDAMKLALSSGKFPLTGEGEPVAWSKLKPDALQKEIARLSEVPKVVSLVPQINS